LSSIPGKVGPFININTHSSSSVIQSCPLPFEIICRFQLEHKAATVALMTPHTAHAVNI